MNISQGLQLHTVPHIPKGYMVEKLDHSILVLHPERPQWFEINQTGLFILQFADNKRNIREIAEIVAQHFNLSKQNSEQDVLTFFDGLDRIHFLANPQKYEAHESHSPTELKNWHLFLHLNQECNLSCPHCYTLSQPQRHWKPSFEDVFSLLDDCADNGATVMTLSGGEPLLYPHFDKVLDHASQRFRINLLTNGTLIKKPILTKLTDCCEGIQISLDGSHETLHDSIRGKGTFQTTIRGIKLLQDAGYGKHLVICTTVMRKNFKDIMSIIELAEKLNVPLIRFLPLMTQGRAIDNYRGIAPDDNDLKELYEKLLPVMADQNRKTTVSGYISGLLLKPLPGVSEQQWCPIGRNVVVDFDGSIAPCILMLDYNWKIGNLYTDRMNDIIKKGMIQSLGEMIRKRRQRIEKCKTCSWKNFCQSGCAGIALQHKGSLNDVDRLCDYRRELYPRMFNHILQIRRERLTVQKAKKE